MARTVEGLASKPYPGGLGETERESTYEDVSSNELSGLPPPRDVNFYIELHPGTSPISMTPHRMALVKLQELKVQL